MVGETPKILTIQHSKRVKATTTKVVDQTITNVTIIEEDGKIKRATSNVITAKHLDILLMNVTPTRMIHKKLK